MNSRFAIGFDVLVENHLSYLDGMRVGMLVHPASVNGQGVWTPDVLWNLDHVNLVALFGPEHGVFGNAGPGEKVVSALHPRWGIPMFSLYGDLPFALDDSEASRAPTSDMLRDIDVLIVDLQDIGVRCYTFVSTLQHVLRAASEAGVQVIVTDRPIPCPNQTDGPMLKPGFTSFVGSVPVPMVYGMTPGEVARFIQGVEDLPVELTIIPMRDYAREARRWPNWPPWIPPSPGIRSWESAWCYPATVFTEALPCLDCDRSGLLPFQVLGASWIHGTDLCAALSNKLSGVKVMPHDYCRKQDEYVDLFQGIRIVPTDPDRFRPVSTGFAILAAVQQLYGKEVLWNCEGARPQFFDKLYGSDEPRCALMRGDDVREIQESWELDAACFQSTRTELLLYHKEMR